MRGSGIEEPDYLATVDVDPSSPTYSQVIHRTPMPQVGDELHHVGWNACSSCYEDESKSRRFLILPGVVSRRNHILDTSDEHAPRVHKIIEPEDVAAGKYGRQLHFWDWTKLEIIQSMDLGEEGLIPLEVRFHYKPDSTDGFVGTAHSSNMWHWYKANGQWKTEKIIDIPSIELEGWAFPIPTLITDFLVSMDDKYHYLSNWLHGDIRQYDISDPSHPKLTGQVWCRGLLGKSSKVQGHKLESETQMLQLSLDGKRLYVTNSLYSVWDNQFYPDLARAGSSLLQIDCDTQNGGLKINENFCVDFGQEPAGPARAHEMRYPGGDCTSDIWV